MLTKSLSVRFTVPRCRPPQPVAGADCPDPQAQEACAVRPCIHYTSLLNESLTQARSLRSPNSYFMDVKVRPDLRRRPATRQRTDPPLSLTVPGLLQHHHRLLARPDCRPLRLVLDGPLPADRWSLPSHRGCALPAHFGILSTS